MGCLGELLFEIIVEGIIELTLYCYIKLMALVVPEKNISIKTKEKIKNIVTTVSVVLFLTLLVGSILLSIDAPAIKFIGKCLTYIPLSIICVQIILGIIMKIINRKRHR